MVLAEPALTSPVSMCLTGNLHPVEEEMMGGQEGMQFMPEEDDELEGEEESEEEEAQPAAKGKGECRNSGVCIRALNTCVSSLSTRLTKQRKHGRTKRNGMKRRNRANLIMWCYVFLSNVVLSGA